MRRLASFLRDSRGSAAAEMAMVIPLLLALTFTTLEGAHYLYVEHQIVKGVRDGARFGARKSFASFTCSTVDATTETLIKEVTRTGTISGGTSRVSGWTNNEITVTPSCPATAVTTGIYSTLSNAPRITVKAVVPYPSLFGALTGMNVNVKVAAQDQAAVMGV
ncbi:Flp pilus assembly protein TadG [Novosphingobium kunmingense]|uniref:Flp pilus assembly protein TadG n=1 Tax=Novosphingobium kunmingense TaxID=1211806 RepID=A0A2N0H6F6_9SPHN|nr:TadE/TadG family type IV pilus assembly protein [Novosphingobium kunmingense]PKB14518.1 Flp pilus assembly protein TadG [Novosphingobium kunmingense]